VRSLVDTLKARQIAARESDNTFARRLGVSRTTWTRVRLGQRKPGERLLAGVMQAFPSMTDECLTYLRDGHRVRQNVTQRDSTPVTEAVA
jgi:transcriptional regulator with XRE-family HTH domain